MNKILRLAAALLCLLGLGSLALYAFRPQEPGALRWDAPTVKKSLMTFAYKVYGNPAALNGREFVSKIVFHNDGAGTVRNFSVSYQIPDYVPWTTEEKHAEIPPGLTLVKLFYPQLPSKVTQLTNRTTATLETKIRWEDKAGQPREEILRSNIILRGVNEVEYSDLPQDEWTNFSDFLHSAPFLTAMVTPNDPVVKEFVAAVTARTGGSTAGIIGGDQEVYRVMKAVYDYMCDTHMRYTGDQGVPSNIGDINTILQTTRMPRDVILTNQGLCVELAVLWSAVFEHLGLPTTLVQRSGHCYVRVWTSREMARYFPIECTAITPMAVGEKDRVPFDKAVEMASNDPKNHPESMFLNVGELQAQGFVPPELPNIDIDKVKDILAKRTAGSGEGNPNAAPIGAENAKIVPVNQANNLPVPPGFIRWNGAGGMVSVAFPGNWPRLENSGVAGMILTTEDMQTTAALNVFHFPGLQNPSDAMQTAQRAVAAANGSQVRVSTTQKKGSGIIYTGITRGKNGTNMWVGMFQPTPGGVVGVFIGSSQQSFQRNQGIMQTLIQNARLGNGQ